MIEITIKREWMTYWHQIERDGVRLPPATVTADRARGIIQQHPAGAMESGHRPDFAHTPCVWAWVARI